MSYSYLGKRLHLMRKVPTPNLPKIPQKHLYFREKLTFLDFSVPHRFRTFLMRCNLVPVVSISGQSCNHEIVEIVEPRILPNFSSFLAVFLWES